MGKHLARARARRASTRWPPTTPPARRRSPGSTRASRRAAARSSARPSTPFGTTQDFQPFLAKIRRSEPRRRLRLLRGRRGGLLRQAVRGVRAVRLDPAVRLRLPHRGRRADAQGDAAVGVQTALHYATELDNPANKSFVEAYEAKTRQAADRATPCRRGTPRPCSTSAVKEAGALDGDALSEALGGLGEIDGQPARAVDASSGQSPAQKIYLREVREDRTARSSTSWSKSLRRRRPARP